MSYTPKNNFNLKMIKTTDTVPVYTPENNSNLQLKRTDAGEVGFRKKLWKIVLNTCDDPEYYFRLVPKQDSFYKNDSQEIEVVGGVGDFSWSISGSGFSLADATTSGRTNTVSTDGTVSIGDSAVVTVVDSCGSSVEGNLKVCFGALQKILVGGGFYYVNSILTYRMALLNIRGVLDETFLPYPNGYVYTMAVRSDSKIWIGGTFSRLTTEEIRRYRLARINIDGSVDLDFNLNVSNFVERVVIQSDEKLLICGGFISVGGINRNHIARFNTDDTLDMDFDPNADAEVRRMTLQGDKILISGNFETVGGTAKVAMARLNSNGTLDESFTTPVFTGSGGGVTYPNAIKILSNGQILIGGAFLSVNDVARRGLARLSADGILDEAFNANLDNGVTTITLLDNEILITGLFTDIGGVVRNKVAKLELNGDLIIAYDPNVDGQDINTVIELPDKRIMIGGVFTSVGGTSVSNIALLKVDGTLDVNFTPEVGSPVYTVQLFTSE